MNNFDKIIKQKTEQFKVPFKEAHWAEMDGKLNSIRAAKIKNTILGTAALFAVFAILGVFLNNNNEQSLESNIKNAKIGITTDAIVKNTSETSTKEPLNNKIKGKSISEISSDENELAIIVNSDNNEIIPKNSFPKKEIEKTTYSEEVRTNKLQKINTEFIAYNNTICLGEDVIFESLENEQPVSYSWNFGDGMISDEANPSHTYKNSGTYTVSLTLLNRQTGKKFTSVQQNIITILPTPKTSFSYYETSIKNDNNTLKYPYTTFEIKVANKAYSYEWNYGNNQTSSFASGKTIYKKAGEYTVTLTSKDASNGCIQTIKQKININNDINLFAQNSIQPQSSNPKNRIFIPGALLGWDVPFEMKIIDKSGKEIYSTSDKNEPWNGKINNTGQALSEGIYLWQVITYDVEGISHRHQGKIHLTK